MADRPSFRDAVRQHRDDAPTPGRCLVLADGFYEWTNVDGRRQPYRITLADERPFAMAGLYDRWRPPDAQAGLDAFVDGDGPDADPDVRETFAIVTTEPNAVVADLHDRMSVVLPADDERRWLTADPETVPDLCDPYSDANMRAYPVSTAVNDPSNDVPAVTTEIELA